MLFLKQLLAIVVIPWAIVGAAPPSDYYITYITPPHRAKN
jgi:hypothetical protein